MYLRALEIQGFKSFPDKTRLTFEKDITAIVGPNGSGKSNISDAILWVMGEQRTKALRGSKMEDVIFGGTEKRGKLGYAQVSLIIDNSARIFDSDSGEVMLTRRYYRSGESEYFINRESVRLKDINSLLMDTGLGRDGYSIIGQGRIAEIVSTKSTDRREVFEEAAGISRFRYRKEEAERKLERTEENLLRINDKIEELEMQVGPLKEQSETARRYLVLRDELKGREVSVWMATLEKLHAHGIIHRDISPDNIFVVSPEGVKIFDFGAALLTKEGSEYDPEVVVKAGYAPPEQYSHKGRHDASTDVYAAGAVLYVMLTGEKPPESLERNLEDTLVMPSAMGITVSEAVENALKKALMLRQGDRFQTAADFRKALEEGMEKTSKQPAPEEGDRKERRRWRWR